MPKRTLEATLNSQKVLGICFLVAPIILALAILAYPIVYLIRLSFMHTVMFDTVSFAGLENYSRVLKSAVFLQNLKTTLIYAVGSIGVSTLIGGAAALALHEVSSNKLIRSIFLMPWVIAPVIAALLWRWLLNDPLGPIIHLIRNLGFDVGSIMLDPLLAFAGIIFAGAWRSFPFPMIFLYAKLQTIPSQLYESADVDGAKWRHKFRYISLPLIVDVLVVCLIMLTIRYVNEIDIILVMTGGGPGRTTETLSLSLYKTAFQNWEFGRSGVLSLVLFGINLVFAASYLLLQHRTGHR